MTALRYATTPQTYTDGAIPDYSPADAQGRPQVAVGGNGLVTSTSRIVSAAATTNATSAKATPGTLYSIKGYNAVAARYLKFYDKASAPTVGADTPVLTLYLPAATAFVLDWSMGRYFATGIAYALTTGSADNDTGALTAGDIVGLNVEYT